MQDGANGAETGDAGSNVLLETIVAAHYLALQMKSLARDKNFVGRDGAEFLAAALSAWAALAEGDRRVQRAGSGAPESDKQP